MYKKLFLMVAVLFGFQCSDAWAVSQETQTDKRFNWPVGVYQFDVSGEINALRQAKMQLDNAVANSYGDTSRIIRATEQYNNTASSIFSRLRSRRRAEYAAVVYEVKSRCHGRAGSKSAPFKGHKYDDGDVRIQNLNPNDTVLIPGSGGWTEINSNRGGGGGAEIRNPRQEGQDYIVTIHVKGSDYGRSACFIDIILYAKYRFNNAALDRLTDGDMVTLIARVKSGAGVN